ASAPISDGALEDAARYLRFQGSEAADTDGYSPWHGYDGTLGFRANAAPVVKQVVVVNGLSRVVPISPDRHAVSNYRPLTRTTGVSFEAGQAFEIRAFSPAVGAGGSASDGGLRAPMPGKIVAA